MTNQNFFKKRKKLILFKMKLFQRNKHNELTVRKHNNNNTKMLPQIAQQPPFVVLA